MISQTTTFNHNMPQCFPISTNKLLHKSECFEFTIISRYTTHVDKYDIELVALPQQGPSVPCIHHLKAKICILIVLGGGPLHGSAFVVWLSMFFILMLLACSFNTLLTNINTQHATTGVIAIPIFSDSITTNLLCK